MKVFFTICFLSIFTTLFAQKSISVSGNVKTAEGKALNKASVFLQYPGIKDTLKTIANEKGNYVFNNVPAKKVMITISYIGYKKFVDAYDFSASNGEVINNEVIMTPGDNTLETVTIESSKIQIKEDTVSYKIDSTMFRKNDNVEEVLKKLPGVEVDKDGKVTAQGKEVTKVKVNGKEFFGGDVKTATRQLNADMVDKIQIVDDYGDQSAFTGIKDGDPTKTLNIQLKKDKNKGYFGNVTAGGGTDKRYLTSLNLNRFNNSQQISITGNLNNTNANLFDFSRIPGGMGAIAGSMVRSFGGGAGSPFANSDGVGVTKTLGFNYREDLSAKLTLYGSYSFSEKNTTVLNDINQQNIQRDSVQTNQQKTNDYSITDNHRFSFNVEYKIDSFNYIKFNPGVTYRKLSDSYRSDFTYFDSKGGLRNQGYNTDNNYSTTPNFTGSLLFNHRFQKKGRTLSLNLNSGKSSTEANDDINNTTLFYLNGAPFSTSIINQNVTQDNQNHNYGISASFNEQLSKKRTLEFNYAYNKKFIGNDKETFDINNTSTLKIMVDSLSNIYENIYTTNRFGINFRTTEKKYNYSVGFAVQPATIESNSFSGAKLKFKQDILNYFPVVRFAYNFSKSKSFNLNYNGNTSQPTYQQLQPIYDFSNRQNIVLGNPDLRPEFTNTFSMRFNNFDFISGNVFFSNISASFVNDKIVNNVSNLYKIDPNTNTKLFLGQETRYLNTNGYYNLNAFYTYSKPIKNRKYVFNYGGTVNYNNNISFVDNLRNRGRNWIVSQRLSMDYKIKKWLETSGGVSYTLNDNKASLTPTANSSIKAFSLTHSSRLFFKNDFILSYDLEKNINKGYTNNVVANPLIINASLEKQFLKKKNASLKLQAFDLLNQNTNVNRTVTAYSITDTRTNRLQRYFMMSFIFRFSKFDGSKAGATMPMGQGGGMRMGGPGF